MSATHFIFITEHVMSNLNNIYKLHINLIIYKLELWITDKQTNPIYKHLSTMLESDIINV